MLRMNIGALRAKPQGARESFDINDFVHLHENDGITLNGNVTGRAQLLNMHHEINVHVTDLKAHAQAICSRCLKTFLYEISVPSAEREFIIDLQERDLEIGEDVYYIDKSNNIVDIEDMLRQEILLQFPSIPVCFSGCKGLCDKCGINLNEKTCSCVKIDHPGISPFKFLNK